MLAAAQPHIDVNVAAATRAVALVVVHIVELDDHLLR